MPLISIVREPVAVQLMNEHPFARIAVDQTTEESQETVNKDMQTGPVALVSNHVRCRNTTSHLNFTEW